MSRLLLILCGLFCPCLAAALPVPELDADFPRYKLAIADDPQGIWAWAKAEGEKLDAASQPKLWTRLLTVRLLAGANAGNTERMEMLPQIERGIALSRQEHSLFDEFELTSMKAEIDGKNDSKENYLEARAEIGARMMASSDFRLKALYLRTISSAMNVFQDASASLNYAQQALQLYKNPEDQGDIIYFEIKNNVATQFMNLEEFDKALELYQAVIAYCEKHGIRHFGSLVSYNIAYLYQVENFRKDTLAASAVYFQRSIEMAAAIHNELDIAFGYRGLGRVLTREGKYEDAHVALKKAEQIFEKLHDGQIYKVWIDQSQLLLRQKRYRESIAIIERITNPDGAFRIDSLPIQVFKSLGEAYAALGEHAKAAEALGRYVKGIDQKIKDDKEKELTRLQVQLGLTHEEQKSRLLAHEVEESERLQKFFLGLIALSVLALIFMGIAVANTRKMRRSRRKMKLILDHIEEAILIIKPGLKVEASFSPSIETILGVRRGSQDPLQALIEKADLAADALDSMRQILHATLGEDRVSWEMNSSSLPQEITLQKGLRVIQLSWQPVLRLNVLTAVLLVLRDVTESRQLAAAVRESQHRSDRMGQRLTEIISSPLYKVRDLIAPALEEFPAMAMAERIKFMRWTHTLKGAARTLGLSQLASRCHATESGEGAELLLRDLQEYGAILGRISSADRLPYQSSLGGLLEDQMRSVRPVLESSGVELKGYAFEDRFLNWTPDIIRDIGKVLMHGIANAVDHGFVRPRKLGQKLDQAFFQIKAWQQQNKLILTLRDSGAGLDLTRIQDIARERGFTGPLTDVLFLDGVSTAVDVSLRSGRGLGLAAIRQVCEERQGEAHLLTPEDGSGTELEISWPVVS